MAAAALRRCRRRAHLGGDGPGGPPRLRRRAGRAEAGTGPSGAVARAAPSGWRSDCTAARSSGGPCRCSPSGSTYGSLADSIEDFVADNQSMEDLIAAAGPGEPHRLLPRHVAADHGPPRLLGPRCRSCCGCAPRRPTSGPRRCWPPAPRAGPGWGATCSSHWARAPSPSSGRAGLGAAYTAVGGGAHQIPRLVGRRAGLPPGGVAPHRRSPWPCSGWHPAGPRARGSR